MAFEVGIELLDAYGRITTRRFSVTDATIADALTSVGGLITDFLAVSDLGTVKHDIATRTVATNAAQAGANKDVGGTLHCRLDNAKMYPLKIPGVKASMVNTDGSLKIADADIVAYVANFLTGGKFRVSEGNYITEILYGELDG